VSVADAMIFTGGLAVLWFLPPVADRLGDWLLLKLLTTRRNLDRVVPMPRWKRGLILEAIEELELAVSLGRWRKGTF